MQKSYQQYYKLAGLILLSVPVMILAMFMVGEVFGGDWSGMVHIWQMAPLVALLYLGVWRPRVAGLIAVAVGLLLALAYPFLAKGQDISAMILTELLLFLPPIVAGVLLLFSIKKRFA